MCGVRMKNLHPAKILVLAYLFYSIIGCILLSLPFCHKESTSLVDDYFVAISAMTTSGLATVDIGTTFNLLGQIVIFILVQFGGIGYMTFSSFILLCTTGKLTAHRKKIGAKTFSLPKDFSLREFIYHMMVFSIVCEWVGAIALSFLFWKKGVENYIWNGIFHSITSFCTAGLSLFSDSFISYQDDFWINFVISLLALIGSLGFIVSLDCYKKWTKQSDHFSFTSKVILSITALFFVCGALLFYALQSYKFSLTPFAEWLIAFFQTMSALTTTGFNSVDIGTLTPAVLILLAFASTFGAAPSGTGAGLRNTTFASLVAFVKSTLKGDVTTLWHHEIPYKRVKLATVAFIYYVFTLSIILFLLNISEDKEFLSIFFEAVNALNNSGLSMGLTSELTFFGKGLICLLMLMGRVGILTFGIAISSQSEKKIARAKAELVT